MTHIAHTSQALEKKEQAAPDLNQEMAEDVPSTTPTFKGINISAAVVTQATAALPEKQKILIRWLFHYCRSNNIEADRIQEMVGYSRTTLYRVFTGKYTYPDWTKSHDAAGNEIKVKHPEAGQRINLENVCAKILKAKLDVEKAGSVLSVGFLSTTTWKLIDAVCQKALDRNAIVFIYGDGQVGKTSCLEEFARLHNGGQTTFVRIPPSGGVQSLLKAIAKGLHVASKKSHDALLQDVIAALDKSQLLILDEVHEIFICYSKSSIIRCMEMLRYIYDKTHCGMVLCGTSQDFEKNLHEGEFFKFLQQLLRRGLYELLLPKVAPKRDLELAVESYGLKWPTDRKLEEELLHLSQDGFGQVLMRLEDGKAKAAKAGEEYQWSHFTESRDIVRRMRLKH